MNSWNFWRDEYLKLMYPDISAETLALLLDVSASEVTRRAKKLGITKSKTSKPSSKPSSKPAANPVRKTRRKARKKVRVEVPASKEQVPIAVAPASHLELRDELAALTAEYESQHGATRTQPIIVRGAGGNFNI